MDPVKALKSIIYGRRKREAMEIIYSAEVSVMTSGISIIEVLKGINRELKNNMYLNDAVRLLEKGRSRNIAYADIMPKEILSILKSAETKQVSAGEIFREYCDLKVVIDKAEAKMKSSLIEPTVIYGMVSLISYVAINMFYKNFQGMQGVDMSRIAMIHTYYPLIVIAPIAATYFLIWKYPERIPMWNKVYGYVKSAGYLLMIKTFYDLGMSSADAIGFLRRLDDRRLSRRIGDLKKHEKGIEGLSRVMSHYLSPVERALIKTSVKLAEERRVLAGIVDKRIMDVDKTVTNITSVFNKIMMMFSILPISMLIYVLLSVISGIATTK